MILLALLFTQVGIAKPAHQNMHKTSITLRILKPQEIMSIEASIRKGHNLIPMQCGDGQQYAFDGEEDGIWSCKYTGNLGQTERIQIKSSDLDQVLFDGLLKLQNTADASMDFQIQRSGDTWTAKRTSLHKNHFMNNLMVTNREWVIAVWSFMIINIVGWMLWISRQR